MVIHRIFKINIKGIIGNGENKERSEYPTVFLPSVSCLFFGCVFSPRDYWFRSKKRITGIGPISSGVH
jgi:hypothetical protein